MEDKNTQEKINKKVNAKQSSTANYKIMEWKYNQFLGEHLTYEEIKADPENESFLVTDVNFSSDGQSVIVSDKGGRVIMFQKRNESKQGMPKLEYYYEFVAQEKDFNTYIAQEYSEEVKCASFLESIDNCGTVQGYSDENGNNLSDKIDIITAGYRTIKVDRVFKEKIREIENQSSQSGILIPKVKTSYSKIRSKTKRIFKCSQTNEINSLSLNKINRQNFISADNYKVYLWDFNADLSNVYTPIDIDPHFEQENSEKITKAIYYNTNPHMFLYGTSIGGIKLCDLRVGSSRTNFESSFYNKNYNIGKPIANSLLSVSDIKTPFINGKSGESPVNDYNFVTRHYFSTQLWDIRKQDEPIKKFLIYEPIISKLTYLYQNNYIQDRFTLDMDPTFNYILTGGYNNMFHLIDIKQELNTQIVINEGNIKVMNKNTVRRINQKGSCYYNKDDKSTANINFDKKICHQAYSPVENFILLIVLNCIYTYNGTIHKKK